MTTELTLTDVSSDRTYAFTAERIIIVGFAGRDADAVADHVEELRAIGVPVPPRTPSFYILDPELITTDAYLEASGPFTSGEVEPVVLVAPDQRWLTVGSDHTDRDIEASDIGESKAACPKPISARTIPLDQVTKWDDVAIASWADGVEYQAGELRALLPFEAILDAAAEEGIEPRPGDVIFLGTVPTIGDLRPADSFHATLRGADHELEVAYRITTTDQEQTTDA